MKSKTKIIALMLIITFIMFALVLIDFFTGHIKIPFKELLNYLNPRADTSDTLSILIREFRLPRVIISVMAGAALSISGLMMQTMFRNPLAGPYVLGISSGASLGVAVAVLGTGFLFSSTSISISSAGIVISAAIGAAMVMSLIVFLASRLNDMLSILIIGIIIAGIIGAIVNLLQFFAQDANVKSFVVWTMGSLSAVSYSDIQIVVPVVLIVITACLLISKFLNILSLGDEFAKSMGVNIKLMRILVFSFVSILAGTITAYCGPIGFIGIAVPHVARWIFNTANHFILIPACFIIGACFMLFGDILTHILISGTVLPINSVTAIIGAPFVVWIVLKNKRSFV